MGEKLTLTWNPPGEAQAVRACFWDGRHTHAGLMAGKDSLDFQAMQITSALHLEALKPHPERAGVWYSSRWRQPTALAVLPVETFGPITFPGGLIVASGRILAQFHW